MNIYAYIKKKKVVMFVHVDSDASIDIHLSYNPFTGKWTVQTSDDVKALVADLNDIKV